jgi:hypothetical protein
MQVNITRSPEFPPLLELNFQQVGTQPIFVVEPNHAVDELSTAAIFSR